jgi:hypothetical protein
MWNRLKLLRPASAQPQNSRPQKISPAPALELKILHMHQTILVLILITPTYHQRTHSRSDAVTLIRSLGIYFPHLLCFLPAAEATVCSWDPTIPYLATARPTAEAGCVGPGVVTASYRPWERHLVHGLIQLDPDHSQAAVEAEVARHISPDMETRTVQTTTSSCLL